VKFYVGQPLIWIRSSGGSTVRQSVSIEAVWSSGWARLSNGWTVDEDGYADGAKGVRGGRVVEPMRGVDIDAVHRRRPARLEA
jgi:hypothetical protein